MIYKEKGDLDQAAKNLKVSLTINKNLVTAQKALAEVYETKKDYEKALDSYIKLKAVLGKKGDTQDIDQRIDRLRISYVKELYDQGLENYRLGNAKKAAALWTNGLKLDPNNLQILRDLGLTYYKLGQYQKALEIFDRAIDVDAGKSEIFRVRGDTYYKLKKIDKSMEDYDKALAINSNDSICYNNRGLLFHESGNLDRAYEDYSKAISIDSSNPSFFENRALIYINKGERVRAAEDYRRALELTQDEKVRKGLTSKISILGGGNINGLEQTGLSSERLLGSSSSDSIPGQQLSPNQ